MKEYYFKLIFKYVQLISRYQQTTDSELVMYVIFKLHLRASDPPEIKRGSP